MKYLPPIQMQGFPSLPFLNTIRTYCDIGGPGYIYGRPDPHQSAVFCASQRTDGTLASSLDNNGGSLPTRSWRGAGRGERIEE